MFFRCRWCEVAGHAERRFGVCGSSGWLDFINISQRCRCGEQRVWYISWSILLTHIDDTSGGPEERAIVSSYRIFDYRLSRAVFTAASFISEHTLRPIFLSSNRLSTIAPGAGSFRCTLLLFLPTPVAHTRSSHLALSGYPPVSHHGPPCFHGPAHAAGRSERSDSVHTNNGRQL